MNFHIIGQILTLLSYIVFWVSRYMKSKNNMLLYDNISRGFAILAFLCLSTYDGVKNTLFVLVRNTIGQKIIDKSKKVKIIVYVVMSICLCILYISSINKLATICVFICGLFNLYGVIMCDEQGVRLYGFIGGCFYASFLFFTKNYTGFICELICLIVLVTSYLKYKSICDKKF